MTGALIILVLGAGPLGGADDTAPKGPYRLPVGAGRPSRKAHLDSIPGHYVRFGPGLHEKSVTGGHLGQLLWNEGHLAELDTDRAPTRMWSVDARSLASKDGTPPGDPPFPPRGSIRRVAVPVRGGWVVAKEEVDSVYTSVSIFRADLEGNVFRVVPPGAPREESPRTTRDGTTYLPSELIHGDATFLFLTEGEKGGPLLLGVCLKDPKSNPPERRFSLASVDQDGHVIRAPVMQDYWTECAWPNAATWLGGSFLIAQHIEPPRIGQYHEKEEIQILRASPELKVEVADRWQVEKSKDPTWSAYVQRILWAKEGDTSYLIYGGGGEGTVAVSMNREGKRAGDLLPIVAGADQHDPHRAGPIVGAQLFRGRLQVLVNEPARLVELDPRSPRALSVPLSFKWGVEVFSVAFAGEKAFLEWARAHDLPPLYLTAISR